jgi:ribosomal protein L31E
VTLLCAQSFEDFKRVQSEAFTNYRDERDSSFSRYLKEQWSEFSAQKEFSLYEIDKPKSIISTVQKDIKKVGPKVRIKILKKSQESVKENISFNLKKDVVFDFFGTKVGFDIDKHIKAAKFYPLSQKGISNFFNVLASSEYENIIFEVQKIKKELNLNDWGVYLLVVKLSENLFLDHDDMKIFSWFVFNKLGYDVKIAISKKHVVLMHYSKKNIYSTPNFKISNKRYYVVDNHDKSRLDRVYTYKHDYPNASKDLDLRLNSMPNFAKDIKSKTLIFKQYSKEYKASYKYNQNLIAFMATYPQADYETYFNAPMEFETYKDLAQDIKKYIDGKKSSVAINFVLNFVQKAFKYERDEEQFGREKVMFADETLYYDKSDCEDRAILFAHLVKELFGIGVVGVKYKDHMSTALNIPMDGDSVKVAGKKFVIADPTYINANIGQSMPQYRSKIPQSFIVMKRDGL